MPNAANDIQKATTMPLVEMESAIQATTPTPPTVRIVGLGERGVGAVNDAVTSNAFEKEDEFTNYYLKGAADAGLINPPYNMKVLDRQCQENNALSPCIEAMIENIDGTGFEFYKDQLNSSTTLGKDDPTVNELWDFFTEPYPGESFIGIRKKLRRDRLRTGNCYLEVIVNGRGDIMYIRHVDSKTVRLVKLDEPVVAEKTVRRKGVEVIIRTKVRERRYAQLMGTKLIYFKEFGSNRDLDKYTGKWAAKGQRLPASKRATALIHMIDLPDATSAYGVPRWIGQTPSIVGSRKAEEFNNEFFDNGGVPPVMMFINGGSLGSETRRAIENKTGGIASSKNRVLVIETEPTGGSLDNPGKVNVTVERFGDRQEDSMFEKYDERSEVRVRRAFRIPPLFVGGLGEASFATAYAAITITEAQVFKPEREELDEMISLRLIPAMGYPGYRIRSRSLNVQDTANRLKALQLAMATKHVEAAEIVREINETAGTTMKVVSAPLEYYGTTPGQAGGLPMKDRLTDQDVDKNSGTPSGTGGPTLS